MVINELTYFRAKTRLLELELRERDIIKQAREIKEQREKIFLNLGLPIGNYVFNDETCEITPYDQGNEGNGSGIDKEDTRGVLQ